MKNFRWQIHRMNKVYFGIEARRISKFLKAYNLICFPLQRAK